MNLDRIITFLFVLIHSIIFILAGVYWMFKDKLIIWGLIMILTGGFFIVISFYYLNPFPSPNSP